MQFDISSSNNPSNKPPSANTDPTIQLLREILKVQREMLAQLRAQAAAQDAAAKWRSLMERWREEYPELPNACRHALPVLERAFGGIVAGMVDELGNDGPEALDSEYTLQEFLDRYGMRLGQLGNILNLVGPLAEAGSRNKSP